MSKFFVAAFALCMPAMAGNLYMDKAEKDAITVPGSSQVYEIYTLFTKRLGMPNQAGHTMAAAVLTRCMGNKHILDHVSDFRAVLDALALVPSKTIAKGAAERAPQVTYAAATLTCRKADRSAGEMAEKMDLAYRALVADGWVDWLPNAVAASELVN